MDTHNVIVINTGHRRHRHRSLHCIARRVTGHQAIIIGASVVGQTSGRRHSAPSAATVAPTLTRNGPATDIANSPSTGASTTVTAARTAWRQSTLTDRLTSRHRRANSQLQYKARVPSVLAHRRPPCARRRLVGNVLTHQSTGATSPDTDRIRCHYACTSLHPAVPAFVGVRRHRSAVHLGHRRRQRRSSGISSSGPCVGQLNKLTYRYRTTSRASQIPELDLVIWTGIVVVGVTSNQPQHLARSTDALHWTPPVHRPAALSGAIRSPYKPVAHRVYRRTVLTITDHPYAPT